MGWHRLCVSLEPCLVRTSSRLGWLGWLGWAGGVMDQGSQEPVKQEAASKARAASHNG